MASETVGERLKRLRKEHGLTREVVAKTMGTSAQTIYKYETGMITNIPGDKVEKLAALYQVTPAYIMDWDMSSDVKTCTSRKKTYPPESLDLTHLSKDQMILYKGKVYTLNDEDIQKVQLALDLALFEAGKRLKNK